VSIPKSSRADKDAELTCIDAIYSASPLPPPPAVRAPLPPPPMGGLLPPDYLGRGMYSFTFPAQIKKRSPKSKSVISPNHFEYLLIPREILFRYPGLFTASEIESESNKLKIHSNSLPDFLDNARYQWAQFYNQQPHATKSEILQRTKLIELVYLRHMEPNSIGNFFRPVDTKADRSDHSSLESWLAANSKNLNSEQRKLFERDNVSLLISFVGKTHPAAVWFIPSDTNRAAFQILRSYTPFPEPPSDLPYQCGLLVTFSGDNMTVKLAPK
jgi:hypothetical protein